eukprot:TRINITY_DN58147_c0_g1_i1.p1 TRINITY_DN58147_c0_g1~~TRINITY_DN58147_c0_g1_i1.p1  ORF type:complete len:812 (-),score=125.05 TRINITY_DN58147_c0_g1_i1:190-2625(-)
MMNYAQQMHWPAATQGAANYQQQWYMQQATPLQTQPLMQPVLRQHRLSGGAPQERPQPLQPNHVILNQIAHQQQKQLHQMVHQQQKLKYQPQQRHVRQHRVQEEPPAPEVTSRTPAPLPRAWLTEYMLSPSPELGGGAFAEVFKVQHRQTGRGFAVKVMHRPNFALRGIERQIEAEIEAMRLASELSRDTKEELFILKLLDVVEEGEFVYLLLELCEQGDLLKKMQLEPTQRVCEQDAVVIAKQLIMGLKTVHSLGFIHRDIKPDNLLCTEDGLLKIADFGWCCTTAEAPSHLAGTFQYMAPEVLSNIPQTVQADVWSAGVTLYQMMMGRPLLQTYLGPGATNISEQDPHRATAVKQRWLIDEIHSTCPPAMENRPSDISLTCWDFLRQLLHPDPTQRGTVDAVLHHPWLKLTAIFEEGSKESRGDALSPGSPTRSRRRDSIGNVPTPLQPRSYDPSRNMAYTPPVTPEMTPERTLWPLGKPEKENSDLPEVSPERKTSLQMTAERLKWGGSPKDTLVERCAGAGPRKSTKKGPSPQKASATGRRKTIASQMPATSETSEVGVTSLQATRGIREARRSEPPVPSDNNEVPQFLLNKLRSCEDELREAREMCSSILLDPRARERMLDLPEEGVVRYSTKTVLDAEAAARGRLDMGTDVLTSSAPPGKVQRRISATIKSPVKSVVERPLSTRAEQSPSKFIPTIASLANTALAPTAPGSTLPTWPGTSSGFCNASPMKMSQQIPVRLQQTMQSQAPMSPVITRTVIRMPQGASVNTGRAPVSNHGMMWTHATPQAATDTRRRMSAPQNWIRAG